MLTASEIRFNKTVIRMGRPDLAVDGRMTPSAYFGRVLEACAEALEQMETTSGDIVHPVPCA